MIISAILLSIVILFLVIGLANGVLYANNKRTFISDDTATAFVIISGIASLVFVVSTLFAALNHAGDLGTIRSYDTVTLQHTTTIRELKADMQQARLYADNDREILLNADSPVAAYVNAIADARAGLLDARRVMALAAVKIERRKAGPFWYVPAIMGDT